MAATVESLQAQYEFEPQVVTENDDWLDNALRPCEGPCKELHDPSELFYCENCEQMLCQSCFDEHLEDRRNEACRMRNGAD